MWAGSENYINFAGLESVFWDYGHPSNYDFASMHSQILSSKCSSCELKPVLDS